MTANPIAYAGIGILAVITLILFLTGPSTQDFKEEFDYIEPEVTRKFYVHKRSGKIVEVVQNNMGTWTQVYIGPRKRIAYENGLPQEFYNLFEELK